MTEPPNTSESYGANERSGALRTRTFSRYVLPSNRHQFSVHFDVLKRLVTNSRNGAEGVAASLIEGAGVPAQAASMNVRFLRSIGLIVPTERGKYIPTQEAIRFINARSVSDEKARPVLAELLSSAWFVEVARGVFAGQVVMSEDQFLGELAIAAQTDKAREEPALRVIVEYLVYAGILTRDDRGLSMGTGSSKAAESEAATNGLLGASGGLVLPRLPGPDRTVEAAGWETLQTQDFYVKVKSDPIVVDDLIDFLQTLKKKVIRLRTETSKPPSAQPSPASEQDVHEHDS